MTRSGYYDMVIVGGGISGLSMAHYLSTKGKKVLLLDADSHPGGCINTVRFENRDFWMEMGAHTCYNSYSKVINMARDLGVDTRFIARNKVGLKLYNGKFKGLFSQVKKLELLRSLPHMFSASKKGESVASFYSHILGRENYRKLFSRLFSAVIVQDAGDYAADLFLKRRKTREKEYPRSFTCSQGLQELLAKIYDNENITVECNSKVEDVIGLDKGFSVHCEDGRVFNGGNITMAVSPDIASPILQKISPELGELLSSVAVQHIQTRAVVVPKEKIDLKPLAFIIPLKGACYSVVSRDVVDNDNYRGFAFHFKEGLLSGSEQIKYIQEVLGIDASSIYENVASVHKLPLLKVGHPDKVKSIDQLLKDTGIYVTGNFFDGLSLEDCVARSYKEFERYLENC